jgi:hypothetical protein
MTYENPWTNNPISLESQIAHHREAIISYIKQVELCDRCCMPKSAAYWRAEIHSAESCIRQCERKLHELTYGSDCA